MGLNLAFFGKKSVAGVATLKPPKEDGGFFRAGFNPDRAFAPNCYLANYIFVHVPNAFEYYYFLIT